MEEFLLFFIELLYVTEICGALICIDLSRGTGIHLGEIWILTGPLILFLSIFLWICFYVDGDCPVA